MKQTSQQQLIGILRYKLEAVNIDPRKCLEFTISSNPNIAGFRVDFKWYDGIITDTELDPQIQRDEKYIERDDYFRILLSESLTKLKEYIAEQIERVNENEFSEDKF